MKKAGLPCIILMAVFILCVIPGCTQNKQEEITSTQEQAVPSTQNAAGQETSAELPGDVITFGAYEQDNNAANGKEPIVWLVLVEENGKKLLLAEEILDCIPYNDSFGEVTWETCSLRKWLNGEFLNTAFSADEKTEIAETALINSSNKNTSTPGGSDTVDSVFAVSYDELRTHMLNPELRLTAGTEYAKSKGLKISDQGGSLGNSVWWLRSPGYNQSTAWTVGHDGDYLRGGSYNVNSSVVGVRPALWVTA